MSSADIQKIGYRYNFLNNLTFTYFILLRSSRERSVNMVFSADDKVLIKSLYQSATELVQTFDYS